jgi:FtsH ternary system domain X1
MTAENTALRLMCWVTTNMSDVMPDGDLTEAVRLSDPAPELLLRVGRLATVTAARLRLTLPLLGDRRSPGPGAAVLAAAIGARHHGDRAASLLGAVRLPVRAADLLAHHGLVAPAVPLLPQLADRLRDLSPLTGVLDRPGPRTAASCESLLDRLRADEGSRAMIVLRFATPPQSPEQACWRGECLTYIRHEDPGFVIDVYQTALLHYGREHEIRARTAWRHVLGPVSHEPARPTALWWRALAELEAAEPRLVKERPQLAGRRIGTNLFRRVQELESR